MKRETDVSWRSQKPWNESLRNETTRKKAGYQMENWSTKRGTKKEVIATIRFFFSFPFLVSFSSPSFFPYLSIRFPLSVHLSVHSAILTVSYFYVSMFSDIDSTPLHPRATHFFSLSLWVFPLSSFIPREATNDVAVRFCRLEKLPEISLQSSEENCQWKEHEHMVLRFFLVLRKTM